MQRHCADVNSPYKRKCWTNSRDPLTNSLLWVETEASWDLWSTNEGGPSLIGSFCSSCIYERFLSCLAALVSPVKNVFLLTVHYFTLCLSIAKQPGQAVVCRTACLLICVFGLQPLDTHKRRNNYKHRSLYSSAGWRHSWIRNRQTKP
jgi:hypothetical protein